jgi:hypothetical protein
MSENENNFETLRQLLALKRHEIPPPGYFEDFSSGVIARIRASETAQRMPWLLRFLQIFESRPAYPVALASSLCVLLLFGIVNVEQNPEITQVWGTPTSDSLADINSGTPSLAFAGTNSPSDTASLFNTQPNPLFKQVSFSTGN